MAHGQTLNLAFVIARALSAFSDSYGMASLETYFNAAEGGEQEQGALNLREGGGTAETQPLYLIAENYLNTVDQQFREEIALATERGNCSAPLLIQAKV